MVTEEEVPMQPTDQAPSVHRGVSTRMLVVLVIIAVFAGILAAKYFVPSQRGGENAGAATASVTSVRNDASADYEAAVKTGRPVYVLFHSLT
jgi:Na+-translocating ferredoxin:NAD+ oxidoreductase RnfD subunit